MAAGLSLRTGFSAGYSPMTPPSASPSTSNGSNVAQMAYGIRGTGDPALNSVPAFGAVGAGIVATAILLYMWWSLPR